MACLYSSLSSPLCSSNSSSKTLIVSVVKQPPTLSSSFHHHHHHHHLFFTSTKFSSFLLHHPNPTLLQTRKASSSSSSSSSSIQKQQQNDDSDSLQLFEKLKDTEKRRINELEELDRKANTQLERQLILASNWGRTLLTLQNKLKGTQWDPHHSHKIHYSDFLSLLNSNNVQFMEYSNYGQTVSVILPYHKDGESRSESKKDVIFKRHVVDCMPVDSWNDVWQKLHQQLVNVDVINVNTVPAEVYSSVATIVVWSMRLALAIGLYVWIDNMMRPIYAKLIPCDLGSPLNR